MSRKPARRKTSTVRRREGQTSRRRRATGHRSLEVREIESMRRELERLAKSDGPPRWNANPEEVRRSVLKLVLTLVDFIRQLLERQAIRRMENGALTDAETEAIGTALMRLEQTVHELAAQFGLSPKDLNLDLGPIGKLT